MTQRYKIAEIFDADGLAQHRGVIFDNHNQPYFVLTTSTTGMRGGQIHRARLVPIERDDEEEAKRGPANARTPR